MWQATGFNKKTDVVVVHCTSLNRRTSLNRHCTRSLNRHKKKKKNRILKVGKAKPSRKRNIVQCEPWPEFAIKMTNGQGKIQSWNTIFTIFEIIIIFCLAYQNIMCIQTMQTQAFVYTHTQTHTRTTTHKQLRNHRWLMASRS